jgi:hypothetical protein
MRSNHDTVSEIIEMLENDNNVTLTENAKRTVEVMFEKLEVVDRDFLNGLSPEDLEDVTIGEYAGEVPPAVNAYLEEVFSGIENGTLEWG